MDNRSVPSNIVIPHLVYRNVTQGRDWLCRVFGFTEHFHYGDPISGIQIYLGDAVIMLSGPREYRESPATVGSNTQMLTVIVPDIDAPGTHIPNVPQKHIIDISLTPTQNDETATAQLSAQISNRLSGLETVSRTTVTLLDAPIWTPLNITPAGRKILGLDGNPNLVQIR